MNNVFMKRLAIMAVVLLVSVMAQAKEGIHFIEGSWADVQAEAKKQNKPIFMDAYAAWCGPCRLMAHTVFRDKKVGEFYNKNFINYKLDMEKGEAVALAKEFDIKYYPTYLYFTPDGKIVHRELGKMTEDEFIKVGETALAGMKGSPGLIERFNKGERDTAFLFALIVETEKTDSIMNKKAVDAYLQLQKPEHLLNRHNWLVFQDYNNDINSADYKYVLDNRKKFNDVYGKKEVDEVLYVKALDAMREAARTKNEKLFEQSKTILAGSDDPDIKKEATIAELNYYKSKNDWDNFKKLAVNFVNNFAKEDADALNFISREFYRNLNDQNSLKLAEEWIKKSISIEKDYANMETYANILYALKRPADAEKVANEALALAKQTGHVCGQECNGTEDLKKKVEAGKKNKK